MPETQSHAHAPTQVTSTSPTICGPTQVEAVLNALVGLFNVKYTSITLFRADTTCTLRTAGAMAENISLGDAPWAFSTCGWLMSAGSSAKVLFTYDMQRDARYACGRED